MSNFTNSRQGIVSGSGIIDNEPKAVSKCANSSCVRVQRGPESVVVTDDFRRVVMFTREQWATFVEGVKAGEFDV